MRAFQVVTGAMLLAGCMHHAQTAPAPPRAPSRDSLFQLDASRTAFTGASSFLALCDTDVVFLRTGLPTLYGRTAVRAVYLADTAQASHFTSWQPLGGDLSSDLSNGYTYGVAVRERPLAGEYPRYIAYWRRPAHGQWRIAAYVEVGSGAAVVADAAGTTAPQVAPPVRIQTSRAAALSADLIAADSAFAELADRMGVAYAFSNMVAADGVVFGGSVVVTGPTRIEEFYRLDVANTALTWHPAFAAGAPSGDLGFTIGDYTATGRAAGGAVTQRFGKYLTVWRREGTVWKFVADGGNANR